MTEVVNCGNDLTPSSPQTKKYESFCSGFHTMDKEIIAGSKQFCMTRPTNLYIRAQLAFLLSVPITLQTQSSVLLDTTLPYSTTNVCELHKLPMQTSSSSHLHTESAVKTKQKKTKLLKELTFLGLKLAKTENKSCTQKKLNLNLQQHYFGPKSNLRLCFLNRCDR